VRLRRLLTVGIWLATTAAATTMAWTVTSVVARDVTDRPPPVVAHREVIEALQEDSSSEVAPTTTTALVTAPRQRAPTQPPLGASQPQPPVPETTLPPSSTTTTTTVAPPAPPPTTVPAQDPTATFSTSAGVVTASCSGYFIRLVAATPADGYAVDVLDRGPGSVHVHFVGRAGDETGIRLVCFGGQPIRIPDQHQRAEETSGPP
jgi:hypothetical protein